MITVFTAVHGALDITLRTFRAIEALDIAPFVHLVGDDFSPAAADSRMLRNTAGRVRRGEETIGKRVVYHCRELGATEPPNMGRSMGYAWDKARNNGSEALLIVESDVVPWVGIIAAFRQAQALHGAQAGAIAPLYTEVGGNWITSYGGMTVEDTFCGLQLGAEIGTWWDGEEPRLDVLWWAHAACLWIPQTTLLRDDIYPDADFRLLYCDHDLSNQIKAAGLDVLISDRAIAGHTRRGDSVGLLWPDSADYNNADHEGYEQLKRKWA